MFSIQMLFEGIEISVGSGASFNPTADVKSGVMGMHSSHVPDYCLHTGCSKSIADPADASQGHRSYTPTQKCLYPLFSSEHAPCVPRVDQKDDVDIIFSLEDFLYP